jgi:hypothetical protein
LVIFLGVPNPPDHSDRLEFIRHLCATADEMHHETVRLVNALRREPRFSKSAAAGLKRFRARGAATRTRVVNATRAAKKG